MYIFFSYLLVDSEFFCHLVGRTETQLFPAKSWVLRTAVFYQTWHPLKSSPPLYRLSYRSILNNSRYHCELPPPNPSRRLCSRDFD